MSKRRADAIRLLPACAARYGDVVDGPCTASMCQDEVVETDHLKEPSMVEITTIGVDIAKSVFQVHGIDASGQVAVRRQLRRAEVVKFFAGLPPCLVGM